MANLTLKGKLTEKRDNEQITDTFNKRDFCIEIDLDTQFPQEIKLTLIKDKTDLIDKYNVGDSIEADINVRGRRVNLKAGGEEVFNELNVWRIRGVASGVTNDAPMPGSDEAVGAAPTTAPASAPEEQDDLPF